MTARSLLAALRAHDAAMTDGPWEWRADRCYGRPRLVDYGMGPERDDEIIIETDGGYYGPEEPDRAAIAWFGTHRKELIEVMEEAEGDVDRVRRRLDINIEVNAELRAERDHWREARRTAMAAGELLKSQATELEEQRDSYRDRAQQLAVGLGALKLVIEQQDRDMARMRAVVTKVRDDLFARTENGFHGYGEDLDAILSQGAPCTDETK